jgi:hypothetical protein
MANASIRINDQLDLTEGILQTGPGVYDFELTLLNADPAVSLVNYGNSSYIAGRIRRAILGTNPYDFPIGTPSAYLPAFVNFTANTNPSNNIHAYFTPSGSPGYTPFIENDWEFNGDACTGLWTLNADTPTGATYSLTLGAGALGCAGPAYTILKTPGWDRHGSTNGSYALADVARSGFTAFSDFGIAIADVPLPVEGLQFDAIAIGTDAHLRWSVAREMGTQAYEVLTTQHLDANTWQSLGQVAANGTANQAYSFIQANVAQGTHHYRLRIIDHDGSTTFSDVRTLTLAGALSGGASIGVYPNPSSGLLTVALPIASTSIHLEVLSSSGQRVWTGTAESGVASQTIDIQHLSAGIYLLRATSADGVLNHTTKIWIQAQE